MKELLINDILNGMAGELSKEQMTALRQRYTLRCMIIKWNEYPQQFPR